MQSNKRKREDSGVESAAKQAKSDSRLSANTLRVGTNTPSDTVHTKPNSSLGSSAATKKAVPYRGTADASTRAAAAATPPALDAAKGPKKGSYAEIMARAKAVQSKPPTVGVINHKPKDKLSYKKEITLKKKAALNKKLGIKDDEKGLSSSRSMSSSPAPSTRDGEKVLHPKRKGTVKPAKPQPTYKGTMNPGSAKIQAPASNNTGGKASRPRYDEYAASDEDDLEDADIEEYGSEESDDMEAGFSDVEEEEAAATWVARKEDEEEARLEAKLKREKEERRKKLEALSKKAKPQRY